MLGQRGQGGGQRVRGTGPGLVAARLAAAQRVQRLAQLAQAQVVDDVGQQVALGVGRDQDLVAQSVSPSCSAAIRWASEASNGLLGHRAVPGRAPARSPVAATRQGSAGTGLRAA